MLIPLANPEHLPHEVLKARLTLIFTLVESRRELDKVEIEEKEKLCAILAGTHRPAAKRQAQIEQEILA